LEDTQIRYEITQLSDNGINITLSLIEDIELEAISQQQLMLEAIDRSISDEEVKKQIKPILEAILRSQPQTVIKTYPKTVIQINMPRKKYENIGSPGVGNKILIDIKRDSKQI
jgi:biotin-(acetyl-CoA carboxylase) ligase